MGLAFALPLAFVDEVLGAFGSLVGVAYEVEGVPAISISVFCAEVASLPTGVDVDIGNLEGPACGWSLRSLPFASSSIKPGEGSERFLPFLGVLVLFGSAGVEGTPAELRDSLILMGAIARDQLAAESTRGGM